MKITNVSLLRTFHRDGACESCGRWWYGLQAHHYWYLRGMGGGSRLDHPWNLASVCAACHHDAHERIPRQMKEETLTVVAAREVVLQDDIIRELDRLWRLDKHADPFADLGDSAFLEHQRQALRRALDGASTRSVRAGVAARKPKRRRVRRLRR